MRYNARPRPAHLVATRLWPAGIGQGRDRGRLRSDSDHLVADAAAGAGLTQPDRITPANHDLECEVATRRVAEQALRQAQELLEGRVQERTRALADANARLEAANQAKSRFVANVSHEIRTPMNAVLGFADLLAGPELSPAQQRYVEIIQDTGRQLLTLLNDILDIAKLEAGRLDLERVDFSLAAALEQVRSLLAPQAVERGLELEVEAMVPSSLVLRGDPTRLRQVLVNLVGNGLKFTVRGSVTLARAAVPEAMPAGCGSRSRIPASASRWPARPSCSISTTVDLDYWTSLYRDIPPLPELPADRPRPQQRSYAGATCTTSFDATLLAVAAQDRGGETAQRSSPRCSPRCRS